MPDRAAPHVEVAGYALGKLDHDETVAFEAHLAECAACRRELEELRGLPEMLARAAPPVRLPGTLRARTLAAVRQAAQEAADAGGEAAGELRSAGLRPAPELVRPPAEPARAEPRGRRAAWLAAVGRRPWLAAAVAAALVVLLSIPASLLLNRPATSELALVAPDGGAAKGRALVTRSNGMRTFDVRIEGLRPPRAGTLYELWAVGDADTRQKPQRVSLGTFTVPVSGKVRLRAFTAAPESVYRKVGVTEEPDDGNPARQGPVVLRPGG